MCVFNPVRMADWTPVLLTTGKDLACIGENSVCITTVAAVNFLDGIQIDQFMTIIDKVIAPLHAGYAVGAKTDLLIEGKCQVNHNQWHNHAVYDRRGQY